MPRGRMTEQQIREKAFRVALARGAAESGYKYDKDVASAVGVSPQTYSVWKSNSFHGLIEPLGSLVRAVGFSDREVCAILGVKYEGGVQKWESTN